MNRRAELENGPDPLLLAILDYIDERIEKHPERLQPVTPELKRRMRRLSEGVRVDLGEEIEGPVSLWVAGENTVALPPLGPERRF